MKVNICSLLMGSDKREAYFLNKGSNVKGYFIYVKKIPLFLHMKKFARHRQVLYSVRYSVSISNVKGFREESFFTI